MYSVLGVDATWDLAYWERGQGLGVQSLPQAPAKAKHHRIDEEWSEGAGACTPLQVMGQCITNKGRRRLQLELRQQSHSVGTYRFHAQIEGHRNFSDRFP